MQPEMRLRALPVGPVLLIGLALNSAGSPLKASEPVDYLSQIKPLLSEKCYSCHGALKQESDLRLETLALMLQSDVISPGDAASSELLTRIKAPGDQRMPPPEEGSPLLPDQVDLIQRWISAGAKAPDEQPPPAPSEHWAFQPINAPDVVNDQSLAEHPVDALLEQLRRARGVSAVGPAERSLRLRRLYLDLSGLPPTAEQLCDRRPWETIVDELLADPAYGQRWARHWMDVWRYSDWYGLGQQIRYSQKHIWHWRDWIVDSLNHDKGYGQMVLEMLAGDEVAPNDPSTIAGTGYLARNYYLFNRTTWLDHTIEHTGKAFLGLTLNCAKCHDHKYDPISQLDYYRLRAIFEPHQVRLDPIPGVTDFEQDGLPRVFDDNVDRKTYLHLRGNPKTPDEETEITPGVPAILSSFAIPIEPIELPPQAYAPGTRDYVQQARIESAEAAVNKAVSELEAARKRLAEDRSRPDVEPSPDAESSFEVADSFDAEMPELWKLVGDGWQYKDGALQLTRATREKVMVRLIPKLPRDFLVECTYTTTGGTTYKSVSFRFDQNESLSTSNFVYTSAHAPGPKVQVAFERGGSATYPPQGRKATKIEVGRKYRLKFAVRDTLVNVWLDDQLMVAYQLPDRPEGHFNFSGFDATVAFDEIKIRTLPDDFKLASAGNPKIVTISDLKTAVKAAELKVRAANASLAATQAVIAADNARIVQHVSQDEQTRLALIAAQKQLAHKIADAEFRMVAEATDAKKLKAAKTAKSAAEKALNDIDPSAPKYESLRGAKKALESPAHKEPDYPAVYAATSTGRRLAFAKWVVSEQNPLTARVAVNHVWMRHFGEPLVDSVFDFGLRAPAPDQLPLLDYLANELITSNWSLKHLHRLIVTSAAYQLSAAEKDADQINLQVDPNNRLYWRRHSRRMESQLVRDVLVSLAGQLDGRFDGPSVDPNKQAQRRAVYFKHSRDQQDKFLTMFDDADILQCYRRSESIVPQQALALSNSQLAIEMSARIAEQIREKNQSADFEAFSSASFFLLLGRSATTKELRECDRFRQQLIELGIDHQRIESRLIQVLINHNDFVTIR